MPAEFLSFVEEKLEEQQDDSDEDIGVEDIVKRYKIMGQSELNACIMIIMIFVHVFRCIQFC